MNPTIHWKSRDRDVEITDYEIDEGQHATREDPGYPPVGYPTAANFADGEQEELDDEDFDEFVCEHEAEIDEAILQHESETRQANYDRAADEEMEMRRYEEGRE